MQALDIYQVSVSPNTGQYYLRPPRYVQTVVTLQLCDSRLVADIQACSSLEVNLPSLCHFAPVCWKTVYQHHFEVIKVSHDELLNYVT